MKSDREDIDVEIDELAASFPAVHEASDCLAFVRRLGSVVWGIFHQDKPTDPEGNQSGVGGVRGDGPYTFYEARDLGLKLKAIAALHESNRVLNKQGVVRQLADDIRALGHRDFTFAWMAETLTGLGFEVTEDSLFEWVYPPLPV
jgi:hypothetical protein